MIAASGSNSGKTVITTGLLKVFLDRGYSVGAVKCGPDYIDPMFHRSVQGVRACNIDPFLMGKEASLRALGGFLDDDLVLMEGAMGFYDGVAGTKEGSAYEIAGLTDTPVLLVMDPGKQGNTITAIIFGLQRFAEDSHIAGVIINRCNNRRYEYYRRMIERENGLPVLGYLEETEDAAVDSRHLGLVSPDEVQGYKEKLDRLARQMEQTLDINGILGLMKEHEFFGQGLKACDPSERGKCTIAVARDEAFCFYYTNSLERLEALGAEIAYFSPLRDRALPEGTDALYLGGGYPELHIGELARNEAMKAQIRACIGQGMPTLAECGGFLYLQKFLEDREGGVFRGCGVFPGKAFPCGKPVRFGYCRMKAETNSMLFNKGEEIPAHEFHYWDTDSNGEDMEICKPGKDKTYRECFAGENLYAGFPHICLDTKLPLAERFVKAALRFRSERIG